MSEPGFPDPDSAADAAQAAPFAPGASWIALPAEAAQVAMIGGLALGLLAGLGVVAAIGWPVLRATQWLNWWQTLLALAALWLLLGAAGTWLAFRRWKASAWRLDASGLHVRRGRAWQTEVMIPRSRVQHLDIERGPIERRYGLATLIVHTAGTRRHALRQAGLRDADAVALRDALVPASDRHDDVL